MKHIASSIAVSTTFEINPPVCALIANDWTVYAPSSSASSKALR